MAGSALGRGQDGARVKRHPCLPLIKALVFDFVSPLAAIDFARLHLGLIIHFPQESRALMLFERSKENKENEE